MSRLASVLKSLCAGLGELSPGCREAARLQSDALDHPLSLRRRIGLRMHLLLCKWCRRYGKQIQFLRHAAHEHPEKFTEAEQQRLSDEARERIKSRTRTAGQ